MCIDVEVRSERIMTGDTALGSATRVAWHAKTASDVEAHLTEVRLVRDKGLC
jgi:hypothetical protein